MLQVALMGIALACFAPACGGDDTETNGDDTTATADTEAGAEQDAGATDDAGADEASEDAEAVEDTAPEPEPEPCEPACDGQTCGDDGCGGSCGTCTAPDTCVGSNCCTPECTDLVRGDDGCGRSCGDCAAGEQCSAGLCEAKTYSCPEMFASAQALECDWAADFDGCEATITDAYEAANEDEGASLEGLLSCLNNKGCDVTQSKAQASCQKDDCLPETASCEASQNGALMCFEITQCMQEATCPKDIITGVPTAVCRRQCLDQGTEAGVAFWLSLELCGVSECLGEDNYDQCVTDVSSIQCTTEYSDCYDEAQQ